ncbi:MAG: DNA-directed polymerase subunit omega [Bacillota bacterium]|jgi:DNA-directed RNA polymerase subunit omega|nr:DNA-directed polymerase subunit omega [Bacillota bacterium]MDK2855070.1 DNA-directed polymerase subunit omega [Bacillota bacterium]MDK2925214.1 DNA-directed polymerase subunit omega [Bacillota bacterium]
MKGPDLETLRSRIGNKYLLVAATAKRARQLMNGAAPCLQEVEGKAVTVALEEIAAGVVTVVPPGQGTK